MEEHWTSVYRLVYHLAGNCHDADEFTQETFARALENWHTYRPGTNARAWFMRIATNLYLDERRKKQRRNLQPLPDEVPGRTDAPDKALETHEQAELLRVALKELSETTRLVFHLRTTEGLAFREIGELAGLSEEAARWHMHQARVKLLNRLRESVDDHKP